MFTKEIIRDLISQSNSGVDRLRHIRESLPETRCDRRARCCSMLPEMPLIEALAGVGCIKAMDPELRKRVLGRLIGYFFTNAAVIDTCPFLDGTGCLIYAERFLGCRTYGMWSMAHYEKMAARTRTARKGLRDQWKRLGVILPDAVIDFHLPYCRALRIRGEKTIGDQDLVKATTAAAELSHGLSKWDETFNTMFYCDLSYLAAALEFGQSEAVRLKFEIVREMTTSGTRKRLDHAISRITGDFLFP